MAASTTKGGTPRFSTRIGYLVSRGLAKAGSRGPYWAMRDDLPGGNGGRDRE